MAREGANSGMVGEGATVVTALAGARSRLAAAGIEEPGREARLLLAHALGIDAAATLRLAPDAPVPSGFALLLARRAERREPLAYLTGTRGFWSLDLLCSPATLIPRADTETVVEAVLAARPDRGRVRRVLDLGTGTGALLLALLAEYPDATGVGTDIVEAACLLARGNAARAGLAARASFARGHWAAALRGPFDVVVANPPYIETAAIGGLMGEVANHEPLSALDGGADGLASDRAILGGLGAVLAPDGIAVIEIGQHQERAVASLAAAAGFAVVTVRPDLAGIPRAMVLAAGAPQYCVERGDGSG